MFHRINKINIHNISLIICFATCNSFSLSSIIMHHIIYHYSSSLIIVHHRSSLSMVFHLAIHRIIHHIIRHHSSLFTVILFIIHHRSALTSFVIIQCHLPSPSSFIIIYVAISLSNILKIISPDPFSFYGQSLWTSIRATSLGPSETGYLNRSRWISIITATSMGSSKTGYLNRSCRI